MNAQKVQFGAAVLAAACLWGVAGRAAGEEYVVRKGDTLRGLAKSHLGDEERWGELARLNGLAAPYTIHAGQKLHVSGELPEAAPASLQAGASPAGRAALSLAGVSTSKELSLRGQTFFWGGIGLIVLAAAVHLVGLILFLLAAFNESFWWGIGTILIHPIWIVFLAKFWDKAKRGFLVQLGAWGVAACGAVLFFCTPLVN